MIGPLNESQAGLWAELVSLRLSVDADVVLQNEIEVYSNKRFVVILASVFDRSVAGYGEVV